MAEHFATTKDRSDDDDPPLPPELVRGEPNSLLDPIAVRPVEILPNKDPTPSQQVSALSQALSGAAETAYPDFYRLDHEPTEDPILARLRAWRPER